MSSQFIFVSLPLQAFDSSDKEDALSSLQATVSDNGSVAAYKIPSFKIGTLDALVQQAEDLGKLEQACSGVVSKVADAIRGLGEGDEQRISQSKKVNDKPTDGYVTSFSWNKVLYRADRPISELVDMLQKELTSVDNDVKGKLNSYNSSKTNLTALRRQQGGNLGTKSLTSVVDPAKLIRDSEYLESHLIAVPNLAKKDFQRSYEGLANMVVPRSAEELSHDDEFTLYAVVTFKKASGEFLQKCREQKWTPRQYTYVQGGVEEERKELDRLEKETTKLWGEAMRMAVTGWSQSIQIWMHLLALRVFVEAVLRYGLPLDYVSAIVKTSSKAAKKIKQSLDDKYSYLGGNAFGRDKRGKLKSDDADIASEMAAAGLSSAGGEYTAYVYYEVEIP